MSFMESLGSGGGGGGEIGGGSGNGWVRRRVSCVDSCYVFVFFVRL